MRKQTPYREAVIIKATTRAWFAYPINVSLYEQTCPCHEEKKSIPVIILTAKVDEVDRVVGFELGADDYVTKPFSVRELVLRAKAVMKRGVNSEEDSNKDFETFKFGDLELDLESHQAFIKDQEINFTALEFRLLKHLIDRKGRVQTRDQLLDYCNLVQPLCVAVYGISLSSFEDKAAEDYSYEDIDDQPDFFDGTSVFFDIRGSDDITSLNIKTGQYNTETLLQSNIDFYLGEESNTYLDEFQKL